MSDRRLSLSVQSVTPTQLEIVVKNTSGAALTENLGIEIRPEMYLVDKRIKEACEKAPNPRCKPRNRKTLDAIVTGASSGWSVWAMRDPADTVAIIQVFNYYDQKTGVELETPFKFDTGAEFTLRIPLNAEAGIGRVQITHSYSYGAETDRVPGTLDVSPAGSDEWKPNVSLTCNQPSPSAIKPADEV